MKVVIAGAGSAAGAAAATALREAGHDVVEITSKICDLRDFAATTDFAEKLGALDGVIHLVGGWRGGGGLAGQSDEDWDWLSTMIIGTLRNTTRAFLPALKESPGGRFAMVSQKAVAHPTAGNANYLTAKAAAETWLGAVGHALKDTPATVHVERVMALVSDQDRRENPDKDYSRFTDVADLAQRFVALWP